MQQHSDLFQRNRLIVWTVTVVLCGVIFSHMSPWISLLLLIPWVYLASFLWHIYFSIHPRRGFFYRRVLPSDVGLAYESVEFPSLDGLRLSERLAGASPLRRKTQKD